MITAHITITKLGDDTVKVYELTFETLFACNAWLDRVNGGERTVAAWLEGC